MLDLRVSVTGRGSRREDGARLEILRAGAAPGHRGRSGGQSDEDATAHLDAMNKMGPLPWRLSFSYGRALQAAPQKTWSGKSENVAAAQRAFGHRAMMNGLALPGQWCRSLNAVSGVSEFITPPPGGEGCRTSAAGGGDAAVRQSHPTPSAFGRRPSPSRGGWKDVPHQQ